MEQIRTAQTELAVITAGFFPLSLPGRGELYPQPDIRLHPDASRNLDDRRKLVHLFHDDKDVLSHFLRKERKFDKILVLVAVADNERRRIVHVR